MAGRFNPERQPSIKNSSSFSSERKDQPLQQRKSTDNGYGEALDSRERLGPDIATWLTYTASDHLMKLTRCCP